MRTNEPFDWASAWMFERWIREYVPGGDASNPRVSPALADPKGLPPLLIQVGTAELLHDQVLAFARRARAGRSRGHPRGISGLGAPLALADPALPAIPGAAWTASASSVGRAKYR